MKHTQQHRTEWQREGIGDLGIGFAGVAKALLQAHGQQAPLDRAIGFHAQQHEILVSIADYFRLTQCTHFCFPFCVTTEIIKNSQPSRPTLVPLHL